MMCPECEEGDVVKYEMFDYMYYVCLNDTCIWAMSKYGYDKMMNEALEEALEEV